MPTAVEICGLSYSTTNLGDDIQSIATTTATGRKPTVWLDRDFGSIRRRVVLLCNAWMTYRRRPFPSHITPVYHSLSFHSSLLRAWFPHFRKHEPIGCRDTRTLQLMRDHGVDAYLSYCSTLTLPRFVGERKGVCLVDVPDHTVKLIPEDIKRGSRITTHRVPQGWCGHANDERIRNLRFDYANKKLELYARSALVVTSRLHCALPCAALGTPVVLVVDKPEDSRYSGYQQLLRIYDGTSVQYVDWGNVKPIDPALVYQFALFHRTTYRDRISEVLRRLGKE